MKFFTRGIAVLTIGLVSEISQSYVNDMRILNLGRFTKVFVKTLMVTPLDNDL